MISVTPLAVLWIAASQGAPVGVVRLAEDGSPDSEQNLNTENDQSIAFLREGFIIQREEKNVEVFRLRWNYLHK